MEPKPELIDKKATEHLANERTFLAWIRTSIAILSLGFVVAKFGVWIRVLAVRINPNMPYQSHGISSAIGIAIIGLSGVMPLFAGWHYFVTCHAIETGKVLPNKVIIFSVMVVTSGLALAMILYILITVDHL